MRVKTGPRRQHERQTSRLELGNVAHSCLGVSQTSVCQLPRPVSDQGRPCPRRGPQRQESAPGRHRSLQPPLSPDDPHCHHGLFLHSHHPGCCPRLGRTGQVLVLWKITATIAIFLQPLTHGSPFPTAEGTGLPRVPGRGPVTHCMAHRESHGCKVKKLLPKEEL